MRGKIWKGENKLGKEKCAEKKNMGMKKKKQEKKDIGKDGEKRGEI